MSAESSHAWFDASKFGIFIHWTPASIPAFAPTGRVGPEDIQSMGADVMGRLPYAEWYQNAMNIPGSPTALHHVEHHPGVTYDSFVEQFKANEAGWDPEAWAELFSKAGARYVVLVTKHLDGFCLWPSSIANPHKAGWMSERDIVGELGAAVRRRGMRFGLHYVGGIDFTFGNLPIIHPQGLTDAQKNKELARYVDAQWRELISRYRPEILWNDMGYPPAAAPAALASWYRDTVPEGVICERLSPHADPDPELSDFAALEYPADYSAIPIGRKWEACRGIGGSFGFNRQEADGDYDTAEALIQELIEAIARGGNLLLNVGPTGAGQVPWAQQRRLIEIGWWLQQYGEAIFNTSPWGPRAAATRGGARVFYTHNRASVYALVLGAGGTSITLPEVGLATDGHVELLPNARSMVWKTGRWGTTVNIDEPFDAQPAIVLRLGPVSSVLDNRAVAPVEVRPL